MTNRAYGYFRHGRFVEALLPKRNHRKPKTKRLRKKRLWLKCHDCGTGFRMYDGYGVRLDGKPVCRGCQPERFRVERPDLYERL